MNLFFISNIIVTAQDTISYKTKSIVVIDSNKNRMSDYNGLAYKTITISPTNYNNMNDLFNSIPLINFTQYGGVGSLATLSIRGTSSNQSVISIDQIPLNNSANPFVDINLLPVELFDELNIISTGTSSLLGSGAIGGNIDFGINNKPKKSVNVSYSFGSYGYSKALVSQNNMISFLPYFSNSISYETYTGNYPIKFNEFGNLKDTFRTNSKYKSLKFSNIIKLPITRNILYNSISIFALNEHQEPGAVLIGRLEDSNSFIEHNSLFTINQISYELDLTTFVFSNLLSIKKYNYNNSNNLIFENSNFNSFDISSNITTNFHITSNSDLKIDFGWDYNQLVGNMIQKDVGNYVNRNLLHASGSYSQIMNYLPLSYNISMRIDKSSDINSVSNSMSFAINYFINNLLKANLSFSKNFRFPSFNEMYYFNYGNTDLSPEKSLSGEISIEYSVNKTLIQLFGFVSDIKDKIVSVPKSTLSWSAQNYSRVLNYGAELNINLPIYKDYIVIRYNYLLQNSFDNNPNSKYYREIIPYTPLEKVSLYAEANYSKVLFNLSLQRTSYRYFLPQNSIENLLPSFITLTSSMKYQLSIFTHLPLFISLNISNITNLSYEIVKNYPMPLRSVNLTIGASYEKKN